MGVGEDHCWVLSLDSLTNKGNWLIFDASRWRCTALSIPVNRMTPTRNGVELDYDYDTVLI